MVRGLQELGLCAERDPEASGGPPLAGERWPDLTLLFSVPRDQTGPKDPQGFLDPRAPR